jgi:hypothetical protein
MSASVPNPVTTNITGQYRGAAFDRSTRAGRLLHGLYNPAAGAKESTLDRDLAKRLEQRRKQQEALDAQTAKPKPVPKSRAFVELPEPPRREMPRCLPPIGRRPLRQIEQNNEADGAEAVRRQQQEDAFLAKRGAAITDNDKFRLQHKFQFGFEPTQAVMSAFTAKQNKMPSNTAASSPSGGGSGSSGAVVVNSRLAAERKMWTQRFAELESEIDERKTFLREMDTAAAAASSSGVGAAAAGNKVSIATKERRHRITVELQEKIREMKEIDDKLRKLDEADDQE